MEEMLPEVHQAALTLRTFEATAHALIDRPQIVAYAMLTAWVSHWPKRASPEEHRLVEANRVIREKEPDRFLKQRRMALAQLAERLESAEISAR